MKALMILKDIKINNDGLGLELHPNCVNDDVEQAIAELEELKNRSCSNCKHYKQSSHQIYKTCFLIKTNGFNLESNVDFCCNKWEK